MRDISPVLPSAVQCVFPIVYCDGSPTDPANPPAWVATIPLTIIPGLGSYSGSPGSMTFHDRATALFATGSSPAPSNESTLNALALQAAVDFYGWQARSHDFVWNGIIGVDLDAFTDSVTWTYSAAECATRVMSGAYNGQPEELAHDTGETCSGVVGGGPGGSSASGDGNPGGFTGPVTVQSDLVCDGQRNNVYLLVETYNKGVLVAVGTPYLAHSAGCCSCGDMTSSSSASSAGG